MILKPVTSNDTDENSVDDPEAESELMDLEEDDLEVGKPRGVDPKHLSKIWRISHEDAKNTIDVTTQASIQKIIQFYPEPTPQMTGC